MGIDCLAETGASPMLPLIVGAFLIVVGAVIFTAWKRKSAKVGGAMLAAALLVGVGALGLSVAPTVAYAASDSCAPESHLPGSEATAAPTPTAEPTATPSSTPQPSPTATPTSTPTPTPMSFDAPDAVIVDFISFTATGYTAGFDFATVDIFTSSPDATIDWTTFDIDTATPGIQQTRDFTVAGTSSIITIAFDPATRMLTMQAPFGDYSPPFPLSYQVSDSDGVVSTPGTITANLPA